MNAKLSITALVIAVIVAMGGSALAAGSKDGEPDKRKEMAFEIGYFKPSMEFTPIMCLKA